MFFRYFVITSIFWYSLCKSPVDKGARSPSIYGLKSILLTVLGLTALPTCIQPDGLSIYIKVRPKYDTIWNLASVYGSIVPNIATWYW